MAVALSQNFSDLIAPGLHDIIFEAWGEYPLIMEDIYNVEESTQAYETDSAVSGVGMLATVAEGEDITYDTVYQGWTCHALVKLDHMLETPKASSTDKVTMKEIEQWTISSEGFFGGLSDSLMEKVLLCSINANLTCRG